MKQKDAVNWNDEQEAEMWEIINNTPKEYKSSACRGKDGIAWAKVLKAGLFPGKTGKQLGDKAMSLKRSEARKRKRDSAL